MQIKKKLNNSNKLYIIFFSFVLFINIIFSTSLNASLFKISNLEISEPFELNFNREKVIEKHEKEFMHGVLRSGETTVREVMVPRTKMFVS